MLFSTRHQMIIIRETEEQKQTNKAAIANETDDRAVS